MRGDLTKGPITKTMLAFALPMILGNLLQQTYNVADTLIVGRFLGPDALAAVGSSYTLMSFLTSILLGLCMGSGAAFSIAFGEKNEEKLKNSMYVSFMLIGAVAIVLNVAVFIFLEPIMDLLQVPTEVYPMMREYLWIIFFGILATFLYNYFASFLRSLGNSVVPLAFLAVSAVLNIFLDLVFVLSVNMGVGGAALATVISQYISGIGIALYTYIKMPQFWFRKKYCSWSKKIAKEIAQFSFLTSLQQSVMHFAQESRLIRSRICRCRILEMHFRCLWHKIMERRKRRG